MKTYELRGVPVAAVGKWKGHVYTEQDLKDMVDNFAALEGKVRVPIKLGHDDSQKLLQADGYPNAGIVTRAYMDGNKVKVDASGVPAKVAELVKVRAYDQVSAEIVHDYKEPSSGKTHNRVLWAVSLLGREHKAMTTLDDALALFQHFHEPVELEKATFKVAEPVPYAYDEESGKMVRMAEWTAAFINTLPDSSFAYIEDGGEKDEEGKTTPRSLRHLPYKDADGKVDLPHLRNALGRLPQTTLSPTAKASARSKLIAAAKSAGVGNYSGDDPDLIELANLYAKEVKSMDNEARIKELEDENKKLKASSEEKDSEIKKKDDELTKTAKERDDVKATLDKMDADDRAAKIDALLEKATKEGKLPPASRPYVHAMLLAGPDGPIKYKDEKDGKEVEVEEEAIAIAEKFFNSLPEGIVKMSEKSNQDGDEDLPDDKKSKEFKEEYGEATVNADLHTKVVKYMAEHKIEDNSENYRDTMNLLAGKKS